jgi:hypothetical protein
MVQCVAQAVRDGQAVAVMASSPGQIEYIRGLLHRELDDTRPAGVTFVTPASTHRLRGHRWSVAVDHYVWESLSIRGRRWADLREAIVGLPRV